MCTKLKSRDRFRREVYVQDMTLREAFERDHAVKRMHTGGPMAKSTIEWG